MKKVVMTGATGFVGGWLRRELAAKQVKVLAVVMPGDPAAKALEADGVEQVACDVASLADLPDLVGPRVFDVFYHLAWVGSSGDARANYELQLQNVKWTCDAVRAAAALGCRRFVGAGTLAEFDTLAYIPTDGATPNAVSDYGTAKIAAHFMSKAEANKQNVEHIWPYLSNTYGVGNKTQNFVNFAAGLMLRGERASFTPGEQIYDFVNVADVAQALALLGEKGRANHAYYIGSGAARQLREFIFKIRDAIDPAITLHLGDIPFNGVSHPAEVFSCAPLMEHTGYAPRVPFEEGIVETVAWLKAQQ